MSDKGDKEIRKASEIQKPKIEIKSIPYRCPICGGNGLVPNGFYKQVSWDWSTSSATPEKCRACNGTGVLWS